MKKILILVMCLIVSLNAMEKDKKQHMVAGLGIYVGCNILSTITDIGLNHKTCLIPVVAAGVGKELYDRRHKGHTAELNDALATVAIPVISVVVLEW